MRMELVLDTYEALRTALPGMDKAKVLALAESLYPGPTENGTQLYPSAPAVGGFAEMPEIVVAPLAKPAPKRTHAERKMNWTDAAKEYAVQASKAGIPTDQIVKNLISHFGLDRVTGVRVDAMISMLKRKANGWVDRRYQAKKP